MYVTEANNVTALDVHTGRSLWAYNRPIPKDLHTVGFFRTNRGVAVIDKFVVFGSLDAHLVALDAATGAVRWDSEVADYKFGYCITGAPIALDGKVVTGVAGGEAGIRGFVDAYDTKTGKRVWRFWTIPGTGEPGNETWLGDSWKIGGGSTWLSGTYDPDLRILYWGVGNPGPDLNADSRIGDNLYTCSLVALDADTGRLRWHFQFTPHDDHDWDATEIPLLINATVRGQHRKVVAMANRNGFYYLLDRATGEFLLGVPYAKQTWAKGIDDRGRPVVLPNTSPTLEGALVYPSLQGATNWFSPSYSPKTNLFYVAVREMGSYYFKGEAEYKPGGLFAGGGEHALDGDEAWGAVRALNPDTGKLIWEFRLKSPPWAGVLSTGGGLVFGGSNEGNFYALDAKSGKPLWDFQTGSSIESNPISFVIDEQQHVAVAAGRAIFVFGL
jgi:alcohol dehydrogenase (cytochrome c)